MVKLRDRKKLKLTTPMLQMLAFKEKTKLKKIRRETETQIQFKIGEQVEVTCHPNDKTEYGESWFVATLKKKRKSFYLVEYKGLGLLGEDDEKTPLTEVVGWDRLRPLRENVSDSSRWFDVDDEVDVLIRKGWWRGVLKEVISVKDEAEFYCVSLPIFQKKLYVEEKELRRHMDWINGKWVCSKSNCQELELPGGQNLENQAVSVFERKRGPPKGSDKNVLRAANQIVNILKRKRGRPKGSRNKKSVGNHQGKDNGTSLGSEKEAEALKNKLTDVPINFAQALSPVLALSLCHETPDPHIMKDNKDNQLPQMVELTPSNVSVKSLNQYQFPSEVENAFSIKARDEIKTIWSPVDVVVTTCSYPVEQEKEYPPTLQTNVVQKEVEKVETQTEKARTKGSSKRKDPDKTALAVAKQILNIMNREPGRPKGFRNKTSIKGTVCKYCHSYLTDVEIDHRQLLTSTLQKCHTCTPCHEKSKPSLSEDHKDNQLAPECASAERPPPFHMDSSSMDLDEDTPPLLQIESLPFKVTSSLWRSDGFMELFRSMGRLPHFHPLENEKEFIREFSAIGHMYSFSNIRKRVKNAQLEDSRSMFESWLEALSELEKHGFVVEPIQILIVKLIGKKDGYTRLEDKWKTIEKEAIEGKYEVEKLQEHVYQLKMEMSKLVEEQEMHGWKVAEVERTMESVEAKKQCIRLDFERKAEAAPW